MSIQRCTTDSRNAPDLLTIDELIALTGWGRTATYSRARRDDLPFPVLKAGARYYISRVSYQRWLAGEHSSTGVQETDWRRGTEIRIPKI